jgi:uracil phosphoribosyltransferase
MLTVLSHPLVDDWLAELRDVETPPARFRALVRKLTSALFLEASRDLATAPRCVRTPLTEVEVRRLARQPVLVPILRAGLGMAESVLELVPEARVCHLGIYRHHTTLQPVPYYTPPDTDLGGRPTFVLDPMLATGGSAVAALDLAAQWSPGPVKLLGILGAPEGVERVRAAYPAVPIFLCALDTCLNDLGYIVPGLGDAGDRQFGT